MSQTQWPLLHAVQDSAAETEAGISRANVDAIVLVCAHQHWCHPVTYLVTYTTLFRRPLRASLQARRTLVSCNEHSQFAT